MNSFVSNPHAISRYLGVVRLPKFRSFPQICRFVTKRMMDVYGIDTPSDINRGYCFIWAYFVASLYRDELQFATNDCHVVVFNPKTKKYYDSEHESGSQNISNFGMGYYGSVYLVDRPTMAVLWGSIGYQKATFKQILENVERERGVCELLKSVATYELNTVLKAWKGLVSNTSNRPLDPVEIPY